MSTTQPRPGASRFFWVAAFSALAALGAVGLGFKQRTEVMRAHEAESKARAAARSTLVVALGFVEPESRVIHVAAPLQTDSARLKLLTVEEGDTVEAGERLAVLDTEDRLKAQFAAAAIQVRLKQLALSQQRFEIASTLAAREADLARARAQVDLASTDYSRQEALFAQGAVTAASVESKRRDYLSAEASFAQAQAALKRMEAHAAAPTGNSQIDVALSEQQLNAARADLAVARANLDQATIRAPIAGKILAVHAHQGERIGQEGLLDMGGTTRMRAVVEVYQSDVARLKPGQRVKITGESLKVPVLGTIERIGSYVRRQSVINNDPATDTDARVVEVRIRFDLAASRALADYTNLQVRAEFLP
ncbi:HlyD family efflux transporter periplasmic adaptor subunit [Gloeobacter kilaueensis]|uniref:HlyD family efflux transporter periplasmic adaptor subunit n=1 Tax=Gloeobacter kilaueensis TaxID=1416614 RepID=UPI001650F635|nr:HlyD family efflux transporter periplasmic adaptor subunit [Gloeobacter kilaueensis]